jgi:hypothetical protein
MRESHALGRVFMALQAKPWLLFNQPYGSGPGMGLIGRIVTNHAITFSDRDVDMLCPAKSCMTFRRDATVGRSGASPEDKAPARGFRSENRRRQSTEQRHTQKGEKVAHLLPKAPGQRFVKSAEQPTAVLWRSPGRELPEEEALVLV